MNERPSSEAGATEAAPQPLPQPRERRRGRLAAVLMLGVFVCGLLCGSGLTLVGIVRRARSDIRNPERRPTRTARRLARKLDLTPDQRRQVADILAEQQAEFTAMRRRVGPDVLRRLRETDRQITEVLTPRQQEEWRGLVERLRRNWLPPDMQDEQEQ